MPRPSRQATGVSSSAPSPQPATTVNATSPAIERRRPTVLILRAGSYAPIWAAKSRHGGGSSVAADRDAAAGAGGGDAALGGLSRVDRFGLGAAGRPFRRLQPRRGGRGLLRRRDRPAPDAEGLDPLCDLELAHGRVFPGEVQVVAAAVARVAVVADPAEGGAGHGCGNHLHP